MNLFISLSLLVYYSGVVLNSDVVSKSSTMTQAELVTRLNELAEQLSQIGLADEADRAREIATEVRALRGSGG